MKLGVTDISRFVTNNQGHTVYPIELEIPEWNMGLTQVLFVPHGLGAIPHVCGVSAFIGTDALAPIGYFWDSLCRINNATGVSEGGILYIDNVDVVLCRTNGGYFTTGAHNNIGFTRGILNFWAWF